MDKNNRVIYGIAGDGEIMRVVICDDEKVTCSEIEKMLSFFAFEKCIKLEVDVFCKFCSNGTPILKLAVHPF